MANELLKENYNEHILNVGWYIDKCTIMTKTSSKDEYNKIFNQLKQINFYQNLLSKFDRRGARTSMAVSCLGNLCNYETNDKYVYSLITNADNDTDIGMNFWTTLHDIYEINSISKKKSTNKVIIPYKDIE